MIPGGWTRGSEGLTGHDCDLWQCIEELAAWPWILQLESWSLEGIQLPRSYSAQVRGEAFNLTNTPVFGNPGANVSNVTITNGVQNLNGFGIITSASNQRTMRLSARLNF